MPVPPEQRRCISSLCSKTAATKCFEKLRGTCCAECGYHNSDRVHHNANKECDAERKRKRRGTSSKCDANKIMRMTVTHQLQIWLAQAWGENPTASPIVDHMIRQASIAVPARTLRTETETFQPLADLVRAAGARFVVPNDLREQVMSARPHTFDCNGPIVQA